MEQADFVYHLAGINRPQKEQEFDGGNRVLTEQILSLLESVNKKTPLLTTSSTQARLNNPYGRSKKAAEDAVFGWSKRTGSKAYIYRLPNVFGKWCRPNYNSVVATFCNNIAKGLEIKVNDPQTVLTLVYIDDVVNDFVKALKGKKKIAKDGFCYIGQRFNIKLKDLVKKLTEFKNSRQNLLIPNFENPLDKYLYATFTSYFDKAVLGYALDMKHDERGWLAEFIKSQQSGQIFISRTNPGVTRGNHWHHTKVEKFLVLEGEGEIKLKSLDSGNVIDYKVSGGMLKVVDIPAGYAHSIKNTGKADLITLFWADEVFNPEKPDTYFMEV